MTDKTWKKTDRYLYLINRYDELYVKLNRHPFLKHTIWFQMLCIPFGIFIYFFVRSWLSTHTFAWDCLTKLTAFSGVLVLFVVFLILDSYQKARELNRLGQELLFFTSSLLDSEQNLHVLVEGYLGATVNFEGVEIPECFALLFEGGHQDASVRQKILELVQEQKPKTKQSDTGDTNANK